MKIVVADTYYFLALLNDRDEGHASAVQFTSNYRGQVVTTEWVLAEVGDAFSSIERRPQFIALLEQIRASSQFLIIQANHDGFEQAATLFGDRLDKEWSLTDCTSFAAMHELSVRDALTADHHFPQAGFTALLAK